MNNDMGLRIGELIKALGMKKVRFAERVGVDQSYITKLTKGAGQPSDLLITAICREFNVNEEWLRTGKGEMFRNVPEAQIAQIVGEFDLDELDQRIILGYLRLNETDRAAVKRLINSIAALTAGTDIPAPAPERPQADTDGQEGTELDLAAKVAELERRNQELANEVAAMEEEEARMEAAAELSASPTEYAGAIEGQRAKK